MRLVLIGKTKSEGGDDPYPVELPGMDKPLLSSKIGEYVTGDFWHYYQIYNNTRRCGPPFNTGWAEWPPWLVQLIAAFDGIMEGEKLNSERKFLARLHGFKAE